MAGLMSSNEFIEALRNMDENLKNIRLQSININRAELSVTYNFICDEFVEHELKDKVADKVESLAPKEFRFVNVNIKKIATNGDLITNAIFNYIKENYPSASIFLKMTDVVCVPNGEKVNYTLKLPKDSADYMINGGAIKKINDFLGRNFCADFTGFVEEKEVTETVDLTLQDVFESELEHIERRTIRVLDIIPIDDVSMGETALYIEDATGGEVVVCGTITDIAQKETKNGKPFLIIYLDDKTGKTSGVYFAKKNTWDRIKRLEIGDSIIVRGTFGEYNGRKSFTIDKINRCTFPPNFVKKEKFKKKAPLEYSLIYPTEATSVKVKSVFDSEDPLPDELVNNEYVVFDLETTGLEVTTNGIIEIGAVRIRNGKIIEQFQTFVKADYPLSEEIIKLTSITPKMIENAPKTSAVIPDFMKFIDGTILVGQNIEFDLKFIRRFANDLEYDVGNDTMDTMEMSRKLVPSLKKNDLHTLAEYFNIEFQHHRALADAYATADIFIELMKIQNNSK